MFYRLLILFTIIPFVELVILIEIGRNVGLGPTLVLVICTGIAGTVLAKREGLTIFQRVRSDLSEGRIPGRKILDGLLVLVGGILLITPGVLTDFTGFVFILPGSRDLVRERLIKWMEKKIRVKPFK